jgi:hypothetical protein
MTDVDAIEPRFIEKLTRLHVKVNRDRSRGITKGDTARTLWKLKKASLQAVRHVGAYEGGLDLSHYF